MSFAIKKSHKFLAPPAPAQPKGKKRDIIGSSTTNFKSTSSTASAFTASSTTARKPKTGNNARPDGTQGLCIRESARAQEDFY